MGTSVRRKRPTAVVATQSSDAARTDGEGPSASVTPAADVAAPVSAPTLPFHYFKLAIARLRAAGNVPHKIDRSAWSTKQFRASGALIVPAFQFLKLIDSEGRPLDTLGALIASFGTKGWHAQLADILKTAYSETLALGIERVTPKDVLELFKRRYDLDAVQARMAVSFFVHATREADMDIGPFMSATTKPPPQGARMTVETYRVTMLSRLPPFEDGWSEELKLAWFTAFNELVSARK